MTMRGMWLPYFFFQRIPSDASSLLQRVLHSIGSVSSSRAESLYYMQLRIHPFKDARSTAYPMMFLSYYFSIKGRLTSYGIYLKFSYEMFAQLILTINQ